MNELGVMIPLKKTQPQNNLKSRLMSWPNAASPCSYTALPGCSLYQNAHKYFPTTVRAGIGLFCIPNSARFSSDLQYNRLGLSRLQKPSGIHDITIIKDISFNEDSEAECEVSFVKEE